MIFINFMLQTKENSSLLFLFTTTYLITSIKKLSKNVSLTFTVQLQNYPNFMLITWQPNTINFLSENCLISLIHVQRFDLYWSRVCCSNRIAHINKLKACMNTPPLGSGSKVIIVFGLNLKMTKIDIFSLRIQAYSFDFGFTRLE